MIFIFLINAVFLNIQHPLFDKEKAGYYVWTIMHLYSAYIPENPN